MKILCALRSQDCARPFRILYYSRSKLWLFKQRLDGLCMLTSVLRCSPNWRHKCEVQLVSYNILVSPRRASTLIRDFDWIRF